MEDSLLTQNPGKDGSEATKLPHLRLACAVLLQAVKDLSSKDDELGIDALRWLALEDGGLYCELLGLNVDPIDVLRSGKYRIRRKYREGID